MVTSSSGASAESRRHAGDALGELGPERRELRAKLGVRHARAEKGEAVGAALGSGGLLALADAELATRCTLESVEVELHLLREARVEEPANLEVFVHGLGALGNATAGCERLHHQGVELRVLGFLHPVVLEHALEKRVE